MDSLELQFLKGYLTGDELTNAAAQIAQNTSCMTLAEKQAFLDGLSLAATCMKTQNFAATNRLLSALIVAAHESI